MNRIDIINMILEESLNLVLFEYKIDGEFRRMRVMRTDVQSYFLLKIPHEINKFNVIFLFEDLDSNKEKFISFLCNFHLIS